MPHLPARALFVLLLLFCVSTTLAAPPAPTAFQSPLLKEDLDPAAFTACLDGKELPVALETKEGPASALWTRNSQPRHNGVPSFAPGTTLGTRYLRIGFTKPIPVGSILTAGNCNVSVLKSAAPYPGDLGDDKLWTPAERIAGNQISSDGQGYILWTLPPDTQTRALRFTHTPKPIDKDYAGTVGGICVLAERFTNLAPQAKILASINEQKTKTINNERSDTWSAWDNWDDATPPKPVAEQSPWVMLVWPAKVQLSGLATLFGGFGSAEVQQYNGPADRHPRTAADADWKAINTFEQLKSWYPLALPVQWIDFGQVITTQAIRIRMTSTTPESHPHIVGKTKDGKRVWLDELIALHALSTKPLNSALPAATTSRDESHPPIPIKFTLDEPSIVTLVIDDATGHRVRNLVSQTPFPKGENTAWWDGMDDLGRDVDAAKHGLYHVPGTFVAPGSYKVRGLRYKAIDLTYEFALYTAGIPAWYTADHTGGWLSNHTPPGATLFVPADRSFNNKDMIYIGSHVSEGTDGLAWVDMNGRKIGGKGWVGGLWTGAQTLARDKGEKADKANFAYVGAIFEGELRLTAITHTGEKGEKVLYKKTYPKESIKGEMGGLAAHDGTLAASLTLLNKVVFVNVASGKQTGDLDFDSPQGVAYEKDGKLLVAAGKQVVRFHDGKPTPVITQGLDSPHHLAVDDAGLIYVSDHGASHQVKVFTPDGKPVRTIGKRGEPEAGPYDELHMNHPAGLTIDGTGRVWVAERDEQPKRISVWNKDGALASAFYGPTEYGGGGNLDPQDETLFHYKGMTFKIDWKTGTNKLINVYWRPTPKNGEEIFRDGSPQTPHYVGGRQYFSNTYNSNPTNGAGMATIWVVKDGLTRRAASIGRANDWELLKTDAYKSLWPEGINLKGDRWKNQAFCIWCDLNDDGQPQPDEVKLIKASSGGVTVAPDLSVVVSRIEGKTTQFSPTKYTAAGTPIFDINAGTVLATNVQGTASSGGDQALTDASGWTILTLGAKPFHQYSLSGVFKGEARWAYPNLWPGLHASHEAAVPDHLGEVIGPTRLLGGFITPKNSDAGPLWLVNANMGNIYAFTADGLFVAELFQDVRLGASWSMPRAERGMKLNALTLHDENFWPSVTQTKDGNVFLIDGARTSVVRVSGLETIRRLPESEVRVTAENLLAAHEFFTAREAKRQAEDGMRVLHVMKLKDEPTLDGKMGDWGNAEWATVDKRGTRANFNSHSEPYDVKAAMGLTGERLFVAYRTGDANLLKNSGETPLAPFKDGGALDVMLSTNPIAAGAKPGKAAGAGDLRLLVTQVKGKTLALVYRATVPGTAEKDRVPFSSPWRTVYFDKVDDVSDQVKLAGTAGNFELSIPLSALGWKPTAGQRYRGDIGILRGDEFRTMQRVYWSNKATGITADVPSEAELTPGLWGEFVVE